jgi:glycosyltransferase involved in cell wall biosynthesis
MAAYNAEATVRQSVISVLSQDFTDFRFIIVEDGSRDKTGALLTELAKLDSRLTIVKQENRGFVDALNTGLGLCTAEYVARMDADDIAFPHRLRRQFQFMESKPSCVAVSCLVYHIDAQGRRLGTVAGKFPSAGPDSRAIPAREPYLMHPFVFARRQALEEIGGYRHATLAEDADLYWRLQEVGGLEVLPEILGEYRIHDASVSGRSVINGRIQALNSQLAAISARRRAAGEVDLEFSAEDVTVWRTTNRLEDILRRIQARLTEAESEDLRLSVVAKLLELNSYRPYELELSDCLTIKAVLEDHLDQVTRQLPNVRRDWALACARLIRKGYSSRARALYNPCIFTDVVRGLSIQLVKAVFPQSLIRFYRQIKR